MKNAGNIHWDTGTWRSTEGKAPVAEILIAGDWAPIRRFAEPIRNRPESVYGNLLPLIRESDLRIVNLECPLDDGDEPVWKSGSVLKGDAVHIKGLTAVPFEVVTLGNNHVFDYGIGAFDRTCGLLKDHGIHRVGAGGSVEEAFRPLQIEVKGVSVGILSFSEGEDLTAAGSGPGVAGWEIDTVIEGVEELRTRVDAVIVVCHAGVEYIPFPPPYLVDALRRIATAGADLVIGHHPHVPQGVEIHHGVPICYSLGNFVFFQPTDLLYRKTGYLVKAAIDRGGVSAITIVPYGIGDSGLFLLQGASRERFLEKLAEVSKPLPAEKGVEDAWNGFLDHYGKGGFADEIRRILAEFETRPEKGAAMFRNRLTTLQHRHHLIDFTSRLIGGNLNASPRWARDLVVEWMTKEVTDGFRD